MQATSLGRTFLAGSAALLILISSGLAAAAGFVVPPQGALLERIYSQLSALWWKRFIELPFVDDTHPFYDPTGDLVGVGQSGPVWFVAAPITGFLTPPDPIVRRYTVPRRTSLFIALLNSECSNLEPAPFYGGNEAEQRACANAFSEYFHDVFFEIDGVPINNIEAHRVESPQFTFTAPYPNILAVPGGEGTAVADGYFVLLAPLSRGNHTLHYGGKLVFPPGVFGNPDVLTFESDVTDEITVN